MNFSWLNPVQKCPIGVTPPRGKRRERRKRRATLPAESNFPPISSNTNSSSSQGKLRVRARECACVFSVKSFCKCAVSKTSLIYTGLVFLDPNLCTAVKSMKSGTRRLRAPGRVEKKKVISEGELGSISISSPFSPSSCCCCSSSYMRGFIAAFFLFFRSFTRLIVFICVRKIPKFVDSALVLLIRVPTRRANISAVYL